MTDIIIIDNFEQFKNNDDTYTFTIDNNFNKVLNDLFDNDFDDYLYELEKKKNKSILENNSHVTDDKPINTNSDTPFKCNIHETKYC